MTMQYELDHAKEHLQDSVAAQEAGDYAKARHHLLQAARYMLEAAQGSENAKMQAQRMTYAKEFQARADGLLPRIEAAARQQAQTAADKRTAAPEPVGGPDASAWLVAERPNVRFDDVAGLEDVKEQIRLKLIYPFTHPEEAKRFGVRAGGGILLYGPPGTGKTLIAKAIAGELDAAFFTVKPSEIMSKWVGEAEQNVAALFDAARGYERAIIFIDEVESLLPRRGGNSTVMNRVVPQFLAELDGMAGKHPGLLLIGATNVPWMIDDAALRPGRFDEKVYVPLPDLAARRRILELNLKDRPLAPDVDLPALAERLAGYSGADIVHVCQRACERPFLEAVTVGVRREVGVGDFEAVMGEVKASVGEKELKKYEIWRSE
jgi:transitional endoplasmic reticulum ATPase